MSRVLLLAALVCAIMLTALGFGWITINSGAGEPTGWLGLALGFYFASQLVE